MNVRKYNVKLSFLLNQPGTQMHLHAYLRHSNKGACAMTVLLILICALTKYWLRMVSTQSFFLPRHFERVRVGGSLVGTRHISGDEVDALLGVETEVNDSQ